jgi:sarcosine oxidase delta subunit
MHLLCPYCASRRGILHSRIYKEKVEHLKAESHDKLALVFVTFTVKNGGSLYERFTHLRNSMRFLLKQRNNQSNSKGTHKTEMFKLTGGVFAYEFKRGSGSQNWHPHIHMLALIPKSSQVDISFLKQEWLDITGDSSVINIKYADDNAYLEVFAYALKFSEMENQDRWDAFNLLRKERLISSFGELRGVELPEDETDDLLDTPEPFDDVLYRWCIGRGYENQGTIS